MALDILSVATVAFLALSVISYFRSRYYRVKQVGAAAPSVPYYLPFGFDLLWEAITVITWMMSFKP
jgi:hypothetical protein